MCWSIHAAKTEQMRQPMVFTGQHDVAGLLHSNKVLGLIPNGLRVFLCGDNYMLPCDRLTPVG